MENSQNWKVYSMTTPIDSHRQFLKTKFPSHLERFDRLQKTNPEGARAEASIGLILRSNCDRTEIKESTENGGPDFLCVVGNSQFIIEVTALRVETAERISGLSNIHSVGSFRLITNKLKAKVANKARQVSGYSVPRLVAIYCEHDWGAVLVGPDAAKSLLTGECGIKVPLNEPESKIQVVTPLRESAFFRPNNGSIESCRESVSGVLLVHGSGEECRLVGALHPAPARPFEIELIPNVPFCRLREWPIKNCEIETEWVIGRPKSEVFDIELMAQVYNGLGPI